MKKLLVILFSFLFVTLVGCSNYREIPAGYVGKILTPTGWEKGIREAGQVDIGNYTNGRGNVLVLMEASSIAMKEHFGSTGQNGEDDRVIIGRTPTTVDFYVRCMVPTDEETRNAIFAQITPKQVINVDRVSKITVEQIYEQFAKMDVRSGVRKVLSKYNDIYSVLSNLDSANTLGAAMVIQAFKASGVPLLMQNAQFSNIKMDESVWTAENAKQAALAQVATIDSIGRALRRNPEYRDYMKYTTYSDIAKKNSGVSFTIIDGQPGGIVIPR